MKEIHDDKKENDARQPRRFLFWTSKPIEGVKVIRRYYRKIAEEPDTEDVRFWETRKELVTLGRITTIGRRDSNDVCLPSDWISRQHAAIRYENSSYVLYNLTLTNTIKVNDELLEFHRVLKDQDVIEMYPYFLEFQQRQWAETHLPNLTN